MLLAMSCCLLTLQVGQLKDSWHFSRFKNLPSYSTQEEQQAAMDNTPFRASGAAVVMHTAPNKASSMMPSSRRWSRKGVKRFELVDELLIHCLVHSNVWHDVEMYEQDGAGFDPYQNPR